MNASTTPTFLKRCIEFFQPVDKMKFAKEELKVLSDKDRQELYEYFQAAGMPCQPPTPTANTTAT